MIYIWIRRTLNWADEEQAVAGITDPWVKEKLLVWNATFNMSYQRFRYRVAQIAELNHSSGRGRCAHRLGPDPGGSPGAPGGRR